MPDPEFSRISQRGQNTELQESLFQKYLNIEFCGVGTYRPVDLPMRMLHHRTRRLCSPLTRILVWRRATKYLRRLHVSHRRSLAGSF